MNYYAALDVSLRSVHLCVMDEKGEIQAEGQTDSEPQDIDALLPTSASLPDASSLVRWIIPDISRELVIPMCVALCMSRPTP